MQGIKIYGSPWQPWFHDWAFNVERGEAIRQKVGGIRLLPWCCPCCSSRRALPLSLSQSPRALTMFWNHAFGCSHGMQWKRIPSDTDILMTHGPPIGHGDLLFPSGERSGRGCGTVASSAQRMQLAQLAHVPVRHVCRQGCVDLLREVQLRVQPKFHVFGHIHGKRLLAVRAGAGLRIAVRPQAWSAPASPSSPKPFVDTEAYGQTTDGFTQFINASTCDYRYTPHQPPIVFDMPLPTPDRGDCAGV